MTPTETCWRAAELLERHDQQTPHPVAGPLRGLLTTTARMYDPDLTSRRPTGLAALVVDLAAVIVQLADREESP